MEWPPEQDYGLVKNEEQLVNIAKWASDGLLQHEVSKVKAKKSEQFKKAIEEALTSKTEKDLCSEISNAKDNLSLPPYSDLVDIAIEKMLTELEDHQKERLQEAHARAKEDELARRLAFLSAEDRKILMELLAETQTKENEEKKERSRKMRRDQLQQNK